MLGQYYKLHFVNRTGVTLDLDGTDTLDVDFQQYKFTSAGAIEYAGSEVNQAYDAADIVEGGGAELDAVNNSTDLYFGVASGIFTVETDDAGADGPVKLYVEYSSDGGTTYPSDATDFDREEDLFEVCAVNISGAQKRAVNFKL